MLPTSRNALRRALQWWIVTVLLLATLPVASVRTGAAGATYTATTVTALIADITIANTNPTQGPYTIALMPGGMYTLVAEAAPNSGTGLPAIVSGVDLTIIGNGATIQRSTAGGTPDFRIFDNGSGATLRLNALAMWNGSAVGAAGASGTAGTGSPGAAGGSAVGGALFNSGTLIVSGSTFANNHAVGGAGGNGGSGPDNSVTPGGMGGDGGGASGGAISNVGNVVVTGSTFSNNNALGGVGGTGGNGGNGTSAGKGGNAGKGAAATGGALNNSGMLTVINSTFVGNVATGGAGGNGGSAGTGTSGNGVDGYGANGGNGQGGTIASVANTAQPITNSTITTGGAMGGVGGTGRNGIGATGASMGGGVFNGGSGISLTNTIFASNNATVGGNCAGNTLSGGGYNLEFSPATTCHFAIHAQSSDPSLGALMNHGGPTQTMALGTNSAAINNGDPMACAGVAGGVDQRGLPRPARQCSIGAFEPQVPPTLTAMSPTSGSIAGGSSVTLTGAGFLSGATVTFGANSATTVTVSNSATIIVTTPAYSAGTVSVMVTNPDLQKTTAMLYTYGTVSTSPAARPTGAGVQITGSPRSLPSVRQPPSASSGSGPPSPLPPHR